MTDQDHLGGLRGLHQDLVALEESQLRNVGKLCLELEAKVEEFRQLLDKPSKSETSRASLLSGMVRLIVF